MKVPNKGLLSDTKFIDVLKDAWQSGLTGMIRVENGPVIKVVYFQKGSISFASSNEKSDRLTEVLKRAAKLTPEQVQDAQSRLKPNVSLGKTLVELGYISPKDLLWGARAQVDGILHQLLFWNQGKYQVTEGTLPREIIHLNLVVTAVIFEGIMKTQNREWILQHIGSPEAIYAVAADFDERSSEYKLPASTLTSKLNGRRSLHEIAESSGIDTFELCKTVVALEYLNLARPIQDEPLQMALNTPADQDQSIGVSVEDQPVPTEVEKAEARAWIVPASESQETHDPASHLDEKEPEKLTNLTASVTDPVNREPAAQTNQELEIREPQEENIVREEPVVAQEDSTSLQADTETAVPEESDSEQTEASVTSAVALDFPPEFKKYMPRGADAISPTKRPFNWKIVAIILMIAAMITAATLYYFRLAKDQENGVADVSLERLQVAAAQPISTPGIETATEAETTPSAPEPEPATSSDEKKPLDLVRAGRLSEAADIWRQQLSGQNKAYTIQVVIACQDKTVMDTFTTLNYSEELMILPMIFRAKNCYRVLFGQYSSKQFAIAAIDQLPDVFLLQTSPASVVAFSKVLS